jgi:GT2 family glycosyltransferase
MQSKTNSQRFRRITGALLTLSVHFDAFKLDPLAYLTATKWWILGKRVRARGQFARLLGQSPNAYLLAGLREELQSNCHSPHGQSPPIIALIAVGADKAALEVTLDSLAHEGVPALLIDAHQPGSAIAAAAGIDWDLGPWLLPVQAGDRLAPGAAAAYRSAMTKPMVHAIYSDDDECDRRGRRSAPHYKPDWNRELFEHFDYLTGACIVRVGDDDLRAVADRDDWAPRLVAHAVAKAGALHVRRMLHHRARRAAPPVAAVPLATANELPAVSVIIPTRNGVGLLRTCLDGLAATQYPDVEVIVVDNDSDDPATLAYLASLEPARVRVLRHPGPFNYSAINNRAAAQARGRLMCLLNNDIEVMAPDWLAIMATQALRDDVGAVGAKLLYPDGRIQHAGVVIGVGNAAGHAHRFLRPGDQGYFRRHALPQFTSAVTAACLVVSRDRFLAVGGLDEANFAVAYNDVDLCLRLNQRGWQSLYEPRAVLIHHESVSRGLDLDPVGAARFAGELAALQRIWHTDEIVDPYHHPKLSRATEQFSIAI